jgi:tRNA 2-thiouridine synthesizing protein D
MIFSIAIYSSHYSTQASYSAYKFACALLSNGHTLHRVFFYQDGVYNSSALIAPPQDELDLAKAWQDMAQNHQIDMVVCIAAALRRGIIDTEEAERYRKSAANLAPGFTLGGLGQLVEAASMSDRLITFGS